MRSFQAKILFHCAVSVVGITFLSAEISAQTVPPLVILEEPVSASVTSPYGSIVIEQPLELTGEAALLRDALVAGGERLAGLHEIYAGREFAPVWNDAAFDALILALENAGLHALPVARYGAADLAQSARSRTSVIGRVATEVAASQAFLIYARDLNSGLLEPREVDPEIVVQPPRPDPAALLSGMAAAGDPGDYLEGLAPKHPYYAELQSEIARLQDIITGGDWGDTVPEGPTLELGDKGERVLAMRARLENIEGVALGISEEFDELLADAVINFQLRHGLNADGAVGARTIEALNTSAEDRLAQVVVNLERQRWLNFDRGARHIFVNIADFSVTVFDDGVPSLVSRVVVGLANKFHTPEFSDEMTHMVVNPTWNVPYSIATEEMLPDLQRNPASLSSDMAMMTRQGTLVNPGLVDFSQYNRSNFPFLFKQRPGSANALGRVKFMFPNRFDIYLHDTPSKSLFNRDARAFSHGCVRVQKPFDLAYLLLSPDHEDPEGSFAYWLGTGRERVVNLSTPVPVHLSYLSAWVEADGVAHFRADIYGRDARVYDALLAAGVMLDAVEG